MTGGRVAESRLHLHDVETVEHVERKIALQRWYADLFDVNNETLKRLGCCLNRGSHFGIDRTKPRADHPTDAERTIGLMTDACIELDSAGRERILAARTDELGKSERDVAHRTRDRIDMSKTARRAARYRSSAASPQRWQNGTTITDTKRWIGV